MGYGTLVYIWSNTLGSCYNVLHGYGLQRPNLTRKLGRMTRWQ